MNRVGSLPEGTPGRVAALIQAAESAERSTDRSTARDRYQAALAGLVGSPESRLASSLTRWIGRSFLDDGDLDAASDCFEVALAIALAHHDDPAVSHAINCQALVHYSRGELDQAVQLFSWAERRATAAGESKLVAMIHQNLGIIASIRGDLEVALDHYRQALETYETLGLTEYLAALLNNVGRLQTDLQVYDEADRALAEAHSNALLTGQITYQVLVHVNRVRLELARGRLQDARNHCDQAFELVRATGDERWLGDIYKHYGTLSLREGKHALAVGHLRRAEEIAREHGDQLLAAETATELAGAFWGLGRNRETLQQLIRAHRTFDDLRAKRELADVDSRISRLEDKFLAIVQALGESIESADSYTQGHCERVAEHACRLAVADGFDADLLIWFRMGALLHDLGKVSIPEAILNKKGPLTEAEWALIKQHPEAGAELLEDTEFPWDVRPMVRHHHERWDGTGYPHGLAAQEIPRSAQVLAVADVFDALTTDRSYRSALSPEEAIAVLRDEAGKSLAPDLVEMFIELVSAPRVGVPAGSGSTPRVARPEERPARVAVGRG